MTDIFKNASDMANSFRRGVFVHSTKRGNYVLAFYKLTEDGDGEPLTFIGLILPA